MMFDVIESATGNTVARNLGRNAALRRADALQKFSLNGHHVKPSNVERLRP